MPRSGRLMLGSTVSLALRATPHCALPQGEGEGAAPRQPSGVPTRLMSTEHHTPITAEELAHTFEEVEPPADLGIYGVEDWLSFAIFWVMTLAVFLQFFTRYVLNDSFAWTE